MRTLLAGLVALVALTDTDAARSAEAQTASFAQQCEALRDAAVAPETIGLPNRGARVTTAEMVVASRGDVAAPEHCRIRGAISPVDPSAPEIRFALELPSAWNGKAIMLGGGGYDGVIPDTAGLLLNIPERFAATPLMRGYAVFASDSGHQAIPGAAPIPAVDAAFAVNDEALRNFAGDALKKTRDAAFALVERAYGRRPRLTYFAGGSNGGREALTVIQRWPREFDGIISAFPFWNAGTTTLAFGSIMRGFAKPGAYPGPAQLALLHNSVMKACDTLDGLKDGIVSNVRACRFDPASLRCADTGAEADTCLTDTQIAALRRYAEPLRFPARSRTGETSYPGYPVFAGADLRGPQQMGSSAPAYPPQPTMPVVAHFWDQFARYAIARQSSFNSLALDPRHPGAYRARIDTVVDLLDSRSIDLTAFAARGGRLIIYQGMADPIVSPHSTERYWNRMQRAMGRSAVRGFARFYEVPGYGHGPAAMSAFDPAWDPLSVLEAWREGGRAPTALEAVDVSSHGAGRVRPLCEYGTWPRYDGKSFHCAER